MGVQPTGLPDEDLHMFNQQAVCGICHHRFTTQEDWQVHFMFQHDKQPMPKDLMEMLEVILVTVSGDHNHDDKMAVD